MFAVIPAITLLACTLFPAANAYPLPIGTTGTIQARYGDHDTVALDIVDSTGLSIDSALNTIVRSTLHSDISTNLGTTVDTGSEARGDVTSRCNGGCSTGPVDNEDDIWVWVNDLNAKVRVKISLIDGNSNPSQHCQDIITLVNSSLAALSSINVDSTTHLAAIVKLIASLYVDLAIALGKYSASVLAACGSDLWIQLDLCLKGLVVALNVQYSGFLGLCVNAVVGLGADLTLFTKVGLGHCAKIIFGAAVHT